MKQFEYADERINGKEMAVSVMSMMIGVGVLTLPKTLAATTQFSDGWLSILIGGTISLALGLMLAGLSARIGKLSYYAFTTKLVTRPVAFALTALTALYFLMFSAYEVRAIANISKQYLFKTTPVEFIELVFLVVVIYAVTGSRIGLIRLNALFLPLVLVIALMVVCFGSSMFVAAELRPLLTTPWQKMLLGAKEAIFSLLGFETVLFYGSLLAKPKDAVKAVAAGISIPVLLYMMIYLVCVGVFSQPALREVTYPAIELAKEAKVPGEFFERFESLFFIIWIMTIYNTTSMAIDICADTIRSLTGGPRSSMLCMLLAPVIYLISMLPQNNVEFTAFSQWISYLGLGAVAIVPAVLYLVALARGVRSDG